MPTLASKIQFVKFCNVLENVMKGPSSKKAEEIKKFLDQCRKKGSEMKAENPATDVSLYPIMRLLLPQHERERGPNNLKEKLLANLYIRVFCLGKGSKDASKLSNYKAPIGNKFIGSDFAETAYYTLRSRMQKTSSSRNIEEINSFLDDISAKSVNSQNKDDLFRSLIRHINPTELKWLTRIILKDLKLGVGTKKILQAFHPEADQLFNVTTDLRQICDKLHDSQTPMKHEINIFSHFKPMLLERKKIEDAEKLFNSGNHYYLQSKFDGERSQLHIKNGKFKYFTRQGFDITKNAVYGETQTSGGFLTSKIAQLLSSNCRSVILDGELMGWHKEKKTYGSKGMSYDVKKLSPNSSHQPCFVAYDIIIYNDEIVGNLPYSKRLELLNQVFMEEEGVLVRCKTSLISTREELLHAFDQSMENKEEGIVLKKADCIYKPNVREGSGCYKIKAEYSDNLVQDIDLIILGGYYGEGKFTGLINSFLMGVARLPNSPGEKPSEFLSVTSVSNGFTLEKLKELQEKFKEKWVKNCPAAIAGPKTDQPDVWIEPENSLILKLRATELIRTEYYPAGYSLRFPRILEVREDKPWYTACTLTELLSLIKVPGAVHKLTKRSATCKEMDIIPVSKSPRISKTLLAKNEDKFIRARKLKVETVPLTRLLENKEIYVINGNNELTKEQIEDCLAEHRAKIVQTPGEKTFCVIAGNTKTVKVRNVVLSKKYDVVTLDWFKRVTSEENWSALKDFLPWEMLSVRQSTKERLSNVYDEYYDSYIIDADEECLKRSFQRIDEIAENIECDEKSWNEVDKYLFEGGQSPFSVFRNIIGYFDNSSDCSKFLFRFMAGTPREDIDDSVTHVFIEENSSNRVNLYKNRSKEDVPKIISSKWIEDCFQTSQLLSDVQYIIK